MAERSSPTPPGRSLLVLLLFTCTLVHFASAPEAEAATSELPPDASLPPREPPPSLLETFTLNYTIPLEFYYVDDSNGGRGRAKQSQFTPLSATTLHIQEHTTSTP